jgi:hypothetical protein
MTFIHNSIAISDQLYVWKYKEAICVFKVGVFVYVFPRPERNTRERRIPKRDEYPRETNTRGKPSERIYEHGS